MRKFSALLKERRESLGVSRDELSDKISRAASYIAALEDDASNKKPSFETLRRIAFFLSCGSKDEFEKLTLKDIDKADLWEYGVNPVPIGLILSAVGIESEFLGGLPYTGDGEELHGQTRLEPEADVWILSDRLFEAIKKDNAKYTASNIRDRRTRYIYFLPSYVPNSHWKRAIENIRFWLENENNLVERFVRVYHIPWCAFGCRLRFSIPNGAPPTASYSLSAGISADRFLHYPVPQDLISRMYHTLDEMIAIEQSSGSDDDGWVTSKELGAIRRVFPDRKHV